jgi:glycosyltransferase involved in cell wall biosynthesis
MGRNCFIRRCYRHGYELDCYPKRSARHFFRWIGLTFWERRAAKGIHVIMVSSEYMKQELIRNGFDADRIALAPLFVTDVPDESALNAGKEKRIFYVGRFDGTKGADELIRALGLLKDEPWHAVMLGDGKFRAGGLDLIRKLGLTDRVTLKTRVSKQEVFRYHREALVTVMPSMIPESFGYAGIEAFANGTPVIAFDAGGVTQWMEDGVNGFLLPRGDIEGLAERIRYFLHHPDEAGRMGRQGRSSVDRKFSAEQHLSLVETAYEDAVRRYQKEKCHTRQMECRESITAN